MITTKHIRLLPKLTHRILIDVCGACSHRCIYCHHQTHPITNPKLITDDDFCQITDIVAKENYQLVHPYLSGEPFLHPSIYKFLSYLNSKHLSCEISTKFCVPIDFKKLEDVVLQHEALENVFIRMTIEMPSIRPEIIKKIIRKGNPQIMLDNILALNRLIKRLKPQNTQICFVTVVTSINEHLLDENAAFLNNLGFQSWRPKPIGYWKLHEQTADHKFLASILPSAEKYRRMNILDNKVIPKNDTCPFPGRTTITPTGDLLICCHDMFYEHVCGNVLESQSVRSILDSDIYKETRALGDKRMLPICKGCN